MLCWRSIGLLGCDMFDNFRVRWLMNHIAIGHVCVMYSFNMCTVCNVQHIDFYLISI